MLLFERSIYSCWPEGIFFLGRKISLAEFDPASSKWKHCSHPEAPEIPLHCTEYAQAPKGARKMSGTKIRKRRIRIITSQAYHYFSNRSNGQQKNRVDKCYFFHIVTATSKESRT